MIEKLQFIKQNAHIKRLQPLRIMRRIRVHAIVRIVLGTIVVVLVTRRTGLVRILQARRAKRRLGARRRNRQWRHCVTDAANTQQAVTGFQFHRITHGDGALVLGPQIADHAEVGALGAITNCD